MNVSPSSAALFRPPLLIWFSDRALECRLQNSWKESQSNLMNHSMARQADMNKENVHSANIQKPTERITRARAKALGISGNLPPLHPLAKQEPKQGQQPKSKRGPSDNKFSSIDVGSSFQSKRRAVFKDVSNMPFDDLNIKVINDMANLEPAVCVTNMAFDDLSMKVIYDMVKVEPAVCVGSQGQKGKVKEIEDMNKQSIKELREITSQLSIKVDSSNDEEILDIDSKHKDPQMCSLYAVELYNNLRVTELKWRSSSDYMQTVQQDITQEMRGILVDWLVEVCEEYRLASETLYLTVTLIDRCLSKMYIEKQRLQLLGITCMLIASKYEEICAPRVEDFCFITDGTYTRREVLDMEYQVLEILSFNLSVPTVKKFLRRFILAAQSSYKVSFVEFEYLANYLAELTLTEYEFLKFLPSLVAASAVFLAKWTLDQIEHPWNPTLEHYTNYKASDLKATVFALQGIQLNNSPRLLAIRQKYRQKQYKSVATLTSPKPVMPLT
ncbi:unnamed protein product [Lactuca saligna]|uniref:Cyclin N-terminal domain-containing protein n=1 Tax=Lactuca saligna TaxID=75948 RepID=A0AA35ZAQ6_LACSI|nr:unnamed protein product [Lactuca saligna]